MKACRFLFKMCQGENQGLRRVGRKKIKVLVGLFMRKMSLSRDQEVDQEELMIKNIWTNIL